MKEEKRKRLTEGVSLAKGLGRKHRVGVEASSQEAPVKTIAAAEGMALHGPQRSGAARY